MHIATLPSCNVHLFKKQLLNPYLCLGTVLSTTGKMVMNKISCPHELLFLSGRQLNLNIMSFKVNVMKKNKGDGKFW